MIRKHLQKPRSMALTRFSELSRVIRNLGVPIGEQTARRVSELEEGVIISGQKEIISTRDGMFEILPDGSVLRVVVHVPQGPYASANKRNANSIGDPVSWHRYHILWCQTVSQWSQNLRKSHPKNALFHYPLFWEDGEEYDPKGRRRRPLDLCKNCIRLLHSNQPNFALTDFDLDSFLNSQVDIENFTGLTFTSDFDLIPNVYSESWPKISRSLKDQRNWICEHCKIDLSAHQKFLHCHHKDQHKGHNAMWNLEALCIRCHAKQHPNNGHITGSKDLIDFNLLYPESL